MKELEQVVQLQKNDLQVQVQLSQVDADGVDIRDANASIATGSPLDSDTQWMTIEQFADSIGKTQQGVSYLINKGRLKEFKDAGIRIKKTDKWYLDASLVQLVKAEQPLKTVDEKEALNNQLASTQTALIKYREFEKRIKSLEDEKAELSQLVQDLQDSTEKKIFELENDKKLLQEQFTTLSQDVQALKLKPWWKVW